MATTKPPESFEVLGVRRRGFSTSKSPLTAAIAMALQQPIVNQIGNGTNSTEPASFTLQLISPRATGTGGIGTGTGLNANNRIYFAYPSLEYSIPVAAVGGSWPYTVTLSNAPSGMVAETYTSASGQLLWRIRWPNPTTTASNITVRVTDSLGTYVEGTWSITVGTSGWNFVDSNNSAGGRNGSLANPWNSLTELRTNAAANSRTYFRTGTYTPVSTGGSGGFTAMTFNSTLHSVVWLAYPGESPVINLGYAGGGVDVPCIQYNHASGSDPCWVAGFEVYNGKDKAFLIGQYSAHPFCFWSNHIHDCGPGVDGNNSAMISVRDFNPDLRYGAMVINNTMHDLTGSNCGVKMYSMSHLLFEGNLVYNVSATQTEGFLAMKASATQITARANKAISSMGQPLIGGNMNIYASGQEAGGEISYNNLASTATIDSITNVVLHFDKFTVGTPRDPFKIVRNTINGRVHILNAEANDGGWLYRHNVIVNGDGANSPWAYLNSVVDGGTIDSTKVTLEDNLGAASGLIDANGLLTGANRTTYLGSRGHEIP